MAHVVGRLAHKPPRPGQHVSGVLVAPAVAASAGAAGGVAAQPLLLHPDDLPAFTKMHRGRVTQRQVRAQRAARSGSGHL